MKKVMILILSILMPNCFLRASMDHVEMENYGEKDLREGAIVRSLVGYEVACAIMQQERLSETSKDKIRQKFHDIKHFHFMSYFCLSSAQAAALDECIFLLKALYADITKDSLEACVDRITAIVKKELFLTDNRPWEERLQRLGAFLSFVCAGFLTVDVDAIVTQSTGEQLLRKPIDLEAIIRLMGGGLAVGGGMVLPEELSTISIDEMKNIYNQAQSLYESKCDPLSLVQQNAISECIFLLEELSSLSDTTKDSIELYIDKIALIMKELFLEGNESVSKKLRKVESFIRYVNAYFLMKKIEAMPIPSCSDAA